MSDSEKDAGGAVEEMTEGIARNGEHPAGDSGQLILLGLFLVVWAVDSFILHLSTFLAARVPLIARLAITFACMAAAVILVRFGHEAADEGDRLRGVLTTGAFGYVRHPLYLGSMLFYAGLTISTLSLFSLAVLAFVFMFYDYIAGYEEKYMIGRFGAEYETYAKSTGKWMPRVGRK